MARLRFIAAALLALAFAGNPNQPGRPQADAFADSQTTEPKRAEDDSSVIYSLSDMGYDLDLGKWTAAMVTEMVEPSSWKGQGGTGLIRYYAPKNTLLVKQSKSVQSKVRDFLESVKASMPKEWATRFASKKTPHAGVVPADYREPALLHTSSPASEPSYPVPAAVKPPKHLFHFIIRYEGDGIIDDNVVKFMKAQLQGAKSPISVAPTTGAYIPCAPPVPAGGSVMPPQPSYASSPGAVPYGGSIPSAAPTLPDGSPAPPAAPIPPIPSPKKKKEKKDEQKKTTVTS